MGKPAFLFDNSFELAGAIVDARGATVPPGIDASAVGFPVTNVLDWRQGTPYRWKRLSTAGSPVYIMLDAGKNVPPDWCVIGGHNFNDTLVGGGWTVQYYDGGVTGNPNTEATHTVGWLNAASQIDATDMDSNFPTSVQWAVGSQSRRYWRIRLQGSDLTGVQLGILTLGQRLELPGGPNPALDPFSMESNADENLSVNGSPLGRNIRSVTRTFNVQYNDGDAPWVADFFAKGGGPQFDENLPGAGPFTDRSSFIGHAIRMGRPFWFHWNNADVQDDTWLCRVSKVQTPHVGTTVRRALNMTLSGWREVS